MACEQLDFTLALTMPHIHNSSAFTSLLCCVWATPHNHTLVNSTNFCLIISVDFLAHLVQFFAFTNIASRNTGNNLRKQAAMDDNNQPERHIAESTPPFSCPPSPSTEATSYPTLMPYPASPSIFPSPTVIQTATSLAIVPRFSYLLENTIYCIRTHGPYGINNAGHLICTSNFRKKNPSEASFAQSLAAAQDSLATHQPEGPLFEDLKIFNMLMGTTIELLEKIVDSNVLGLEEWAWGVYGLCAGYTNPDQQFLTQKLRLYTALQALPDLHKDAERRYGNNLEPERPVTPADRINVLTLANRRVHICSTLLLQAIRRNWPRVRWHHAIKVCEGWINHLGLTETFGEAIG